MPESIIIIAKGFINVNVGLPPERIRKSLRNSINIAYRRVSGARLRKLAGLTKLPDTCDGGQRCPECQVQRLVPRVHAVNTCLKTCARLTRIGDQGSVLLGEFYCVGKSVKHEYKNRTSQIAVYSSTGWYAGPPKPPLDF